MKIFRLISIAFIALTYFGCSDGNTQQTVADQTSEGAGIASNSIEDLFKRSMEDVEPTKYHEFIDPNNGLVQARYPIPKSWKVHHPDDPIYIEGPGKLTVYKAVTENFAWSTNPMMQQTLQMNGQRIAQPMNTQQVLRQMVQPNAEAQGYTLLKTYPLPEVSGLWQRLINAMPNTGSVRRVEALGTEWTTGNGRKSLIVLVQHQVAQQQTVFWTVQTTEMEVDPSQFDQAKTAYFYSSANAQLNPQWIQYMNGKLVGDIQKSNQFWAQATAQSAAAHQQRMSAIAARGQTALSTGKTYSDILDISHQGYLNRSSINDAGHAKTVRSINETTLIGNHESGEHYDVPAGSNYYWVSGDGYYLGTDNALLDPNIDKRLNDKNWTKFAHE
ncbi:MAG: hypothetical protein K9I85_08725 [Saprospiraceae bacterium]|nr:hypothetical protein [Saprospiraceae bacterium]